jgi:hypothetical protein
VLVEFVDDDDVPAVPIERAPLAADGPEHAPRARDGQRRHVALDQAREHRGGPDHLVRVRIADAGLVARRGSDERLGSRFVVRDETEQGDPRTHGRLP